VNHRYLRFWRRLGRDGQERRLIVVEVRRARRFLRRRRDGGDLQVTADRRAG
jgi:hypothetical protein